MMLSAEITLYPLKEDYRPIISQFIDRLAAADNVKKQTFPTCTVLTGDYDDVMALFSNLMKWSFETFGKQVFVVKFLPGFEAL